MIKINKENRKYTRCLACYEKEVKKITIGTNENQTSSVFLCNKCIRELYMKNLRDKDEIESEIDAKCSKCKHLKNPFFIPCTNCSKGNDLNYWEADNGTTNT